jgi:predicted porin
MKKTLIALASVAALGAAHADVTLYGVIDIGLSTTNNQLSSDANNPANSNFYPSTAQSATTGRQTGFTNGTLTPSRFGIKGSENLEFAPGLKANFVLEGRFQPSAGVTPDDHSLLASKNGTAQYGGGDSALNNGIFNSQSTVGLSGGFGSVDVGYMLNLVGDAYGANDPFGAGYVSPFGTYGGLTGMGSSYTGRTSNAIKFKTDFGTTKLGLFYSMGGETGSAAAGSQWGLSVASAITPTINVTVVAQAMKDNVSFGSSPSATTAGLDTTANQTAGVAATVYVPALSATYYDSSSASIMGNWMATNQAKLFAGYTSIVQSNPTDAAADKLITQVQGVPINMTAYNGLNVAKYQSNLKTTIAWAGVKYDLDNQNHIMAAYYLRSVGAYSALTTSDASKAGSTTLGSALYSDNKQNIYTAMYDRDLSLQTDVYAYAIFNQFDTQGGAAASTTTPQSQWGTLSGLSINQYGVGIRMKF